MKFKRLDRKKIEKINIKKSNWNFQGKSTGGSEKNKSWKRIKL